MFWTSLAIVLGVLLSVPRDPSVGPAIAGFLLLGLGVVAYFTNVRLIVFYIQKKVPSVFLKTEKLADGEYLWEKTAGLGIVPRWVSRIGILSYYLLGYAALFLIFALIRWCGTHFLGWAR